MKSICSQIKILKEPLQGYLGLADKNFLSHSLKIFFYIESIELVGNLLQAVDWIERTERGGVFVSASHDQKLNIYTTIAALIRKYCDACEGTERLEDSFCKYGLPFLPTQIWRKYNSTTSNMYRLQEFPQLAPHYASLLKDPSVHLKYSNISLNQTWTTPATSKGSW